MTAYSCNTIVDYQTIDGAMPLLFSIRDCVPIAFDALLIAIFFVLLAGNYYLGMGKTGRPKIIISFLASSVSTMILSLFFALAQLVEFKSVLFWAFLSIIAFALIVITNKD